MSQRKARVEHALRDVLTELIASEVKDPRVRAAALVTVTKVELNVDMAVANVYVSVVSPGGDDDAVADDVIAGLSKAAGFLRGPAARRLSLQRAPELRFKLDASVDMNEKLAAILREDEEKARAAGRGPAAVAATPAGEGSAGSGAAPAGEATEAGEAGEAGGTAGARGAPGEAAR